MQPPAQTPNAAVLTVSELNQAIKQGLEAAFPLVWIQGEISNLARPASGHLYFTLKDARAQVRCALFRARHKLLGCTPEDGLQVRVRARVTLYEARGDYQLLVEHIEEAGEGALQQAFEALKRKLAAEGLFDPALRKPLPRVPRRIGVITSASGSVIHDILSTLKRRFPGIPVRLYPVAVQGDAAVAQLKQALSAASLRGDCDVLLLARGGGSLEDMQAFNDESVARAIAACTLPVVSGVGHETDVTIADFVADRRAPTPTAAAELLSPDQAQWLSLLAEREARLLRRIDTTLNQAGQKLDWVSRRLAQPRTRLTHMAQRIAHLASRSRYAMQLRLQTRFRQAQQLDATLQRLSPRARIRQQYGKNQQLQSSLKHLMQHRLLGLKHRLQQSAGTLDTLSPLATLGRGYALAQTADGRVVRQAQDVRVGEPLHTRLARGRVISTITDVFDEEQ